MDEEVARQYVACCESWREDLECLFSYLSPRFERVDRQRHAWEDLLELLSAVERKNGWQLAEASEHATPYSVQHLLDRAPWDADAVRAWLTLRCAALEHEIFLVLYLDIQNHLIEDEEIFRGTLTHTSVYPREVVKSALARNAASVILAHNHPGGRPEPSTADRTLTTQLASALSMVEVRVLDHFIVAGDSIVSFAEQGLL